jgi:nucleoside-diphosphate kinase
MIERTLLLIKPDGVSRALIGKIISCVEDSGLKVIAMKVVLPDKKTAGMHYAADEAWLNNVGNKQIATYKEKGIKINAEPRDLGIKVRNQLITFISSGPVVPMVVEGNEAIFIVRKMIGATEPRKSDPSTIRGRYASDSYDLADKRGTPIKNLVHASEDSKTAKREIDIWFKKSEIVSYGRADDAAII